MKYFNKLWLVAAGIVLMTSCADKSLLDFTVSQSDSIANLVYLNDYKALKSYVDSVANPQFKLGVAVSADDFLKKGLIYSLVKYNFKEITDANAMKHYSVVQDDGSLNLGKVQNLI